MDIPEIDPQAEYSFAEVARLVPSPRAGKRTQIKTLHRWKNAGLLKARRRGRFWFVTGLELLRLLGRDDSSPPSRSVVQRARDVARAERMAERLGV